jgi:hypothetical protein
MFAREQLSQPHRGGDIRGVSNRERMTYDTLAPRALEQVASRIAGDLGAMAGGKQSEREREDLGFTAGESSFRIDAEDAQGRSRSRRDDIDRSRALGHRIGLRLAGLGIRLQSF